MIRRYVGVGPVAVSVMWVVLLAGLAPAASGEMLLDGLHFDRRVDQVMISVKFVEVQSTSLNLLGFDIGNLATPAFSVVIDTVGSNASLQTQDLTLIDGVPYVMFQRRDDLSVFQPMLKLWTPTLSQTFQPTVGDTAVFGALRDAADRQVKSVPDGTTFLIGSVLTFDQNNDHKNTPLLSQLPVVGSLFQQGSEVGDPIDTPVIKPSLAKFGSDRSFLSVLRQAPAQVHVTELDRDGMATGAKIGVSLAAGFSAFVDASHAPAVTAHDTTLMQYVPVFDVTKSRSSTFAVGFNTLNLANNFKYDLSYRDDEIIRGLDATRLRLRERNGVDPYEAFHIPAIATSFVAQTPQGKGVGVQLSDRFGSETSFRYLINDLTFEQLDDPRVDDAGRGDIVVGWTEQMAGSVGIQLKHFQISPVLEWAADQLKNPTPGDNSIFRQRRVERLILNDSVISMNPLGLQFTGMHQGDTHSVTEDPDAPGNFVHQFQFMESFSLTGRTMTNLRDLPDPGSADQLRIVTDLRTRLSFEGEAVAFGLAVELALIDPLDTGSRLDLGRVPILGKLPILGTLFQKNQWLHEQEDLLILLQSQIIFEESQGLLSQAEPDLLARYLAGEPILTEFTLLAASGAPVQLLVDDLTVTVELVPEPASAMVLGMLGLCLLTSRPRSRGCRPSPRRLRSAA